MDQPQCSKCGRYIPHSRATLHGALEPPPMVGWVEWWEGLCRSCDPEGEPRRPTPPTPGR